MIEPSLENKSFVVTGATSGIGLAAAETLARQGAYVIGSPERCREAVQRLRSLNPDGAAAFCVADLALQSQVRALAQEIEGVLAANGRTWLDGLVNNAGTFTYWLTLTPEGFETQWAVNHLAPFLLTRLLLPLLEAAPAARVVTVSSDSHYGPQLDWEDLQLRRRYDGLRAYHQTKLANVLFTLELNQRLAGHPNLRAFAADPGLVKTDIGLKGTPPLVRWVWQRRRAGGVPAEQSGSWVAYLAAEPSIQGSSEIYWKEGSPRKASRQALDSAAASRLWQVSEQMCAMGSEN